MPDEVTLSIICPVYNCRDFVDDLVDSLVDAANFEEIELVFVDDASTDGSEQALQAALKRHDNAIRFSCKCVRHEQNRGRATARTTGIKAASGRYLGFVDGDDVLLPGYGAFCLEALRATRLPILEFSYTEFQQRQELERDLPSAPAAGRTFVGKDRHKTLFKHGFFIWSRIFSRTLVVDTMLRTDRRGYEDLAFTIDAFARAEGVYRIDVPLIGYRRRAGSITSARTRQYVELYEQLTEAMQRNRGRFEPNLDFECRYLKKLITILLKGVKIRPAADRRYFYHKILRDLRLRGLAASRFSLLMSKLVSYFLLCFSTAFTR